MRCEISGTRESLVALGTTIFDVGDSRTSVLSQLKRIVVQLPAQFALIRPESVFDFGQLGSGFFGYLDNVESGINVTGDDGFVGS